MRTKPTTTASAPETRKCDTCGSEVWPTRWDHHKTWCNVENKRTIPAEKPTERYYNNGQFVCDSVTDEDISVEREIAILNSADKLAEALRKFVQAYRLQSDHDLECAEAIATQALATYDNER